MTRVAAIDCGTHTLRLLIADMSPPQSQHGAILVDHMRRMEVVRLGRGVDRTRRLSPEAMERAQVVLEDYAREIESSRVDRVRMVATSASRDAENAGDFQKMVRTTLGISPEVISGDEEARLAFAGAVATLPRNVPHPVLVVDIGGGSTEFVVGVPNTEPHAARVLDAISVDIGCVRLTERYLSADPPSLTDIAAAKAETIAVVDRALTAVDAGRARTLIGLAGSVTTVAGVVFGLDSYRPEKLHHAWVENADVMEASERLLAATRAERAAIPVMHPERVDVIGAGALIMRTILERAGFGGILASEHDILDGIAWSLV